MLEYAFVCYLDNDTENIFRSIWNDLSKSDITQYGVENKALRPHITIADYSDLDKNRFMKLLEQFYKDKKRIEISLNVLGTFINTGTLFLAPAMSYGLNDLHRNHHNAFGMFDTNENSLYLPGKWTPHCTIASRLDANKIIRAFEYCSRAISKKTAVLTEIALTEIAVNELGVTEEINDIYIKTLN